MAHPLCNDTLRAAPPRPSPAVIPPAPTLSEGICFFFPVLTHHSPLATRHFFLPRPSFALFASRMGLRDAPTSLPIFFPFLSLATRHSPLLLPRPSFRAEQADDSLALCSCKGSACAAEESLRSSNLSRRLYVAIFFPAFCRAAGIYPPRSGHLRSLHPDDPSGRANVTPLHSPLTTSSSLSSALPDVIPPAPMSGSEARFLQLGSALRCKRADDRRKEGL